MADPTPDMAAYRAESQAARAEAIAYRAEVAAYRAEVAAWRDSSEHRIAQLTEYVVKIDSRVSRLEHRFDALDAEVAKVAEVVFEIRRMLDER